MTRSLLVRSAAVAATAGALGVACTGVASAATSHPAVSGTDVSVTFTVEPGQAFDVCTAALTPLTYAPTLTDKLTGGNLAELGKALDDRNVIVLRDPQGLPGGAPSALGPATVTAKAVPANVYALVTYCTSTRKPAVATLLVGDPIAAGTGALQNLAADPMALSSVLAKVAAGGITLGAN